MVLCYKPLFISNFYPVKWARYFSNNIQILLAHFLNLWMLLYRTCEQYTNISSVMCLADNNKRIPPNTTKGVDCINRKFAYINFRSKCAMFK
jgi:hypothetical protein